jgi:hypothetical protein
VSLGFLFGAIFVKAAHWITDKPENTFGDILLAGCFWGLAAICLWQGTWILLSGHALNPLHSAPSHRFAENIVVLPVVIAEEELGDVDAKH